MAWCFSENGGYPGGVVGAFWISTRMIYLLGIDYKY